MLTTPFDWNLFRVRFDDRVRRAKGILAGSLSTSRGHLQRWIMHERAPWRSLAPLDTNIPGMITWEEMQYYEFIGSWYLGRGEAVELGPWLGKSTTHIMRALQANPNFAGRRLDVFDDFIWRSDWMNRHAPSDHHLDNHADFYPIFEGYVRPIASGLSVHRVKISDYDGNEYLPKISWDRRPIEVMYIDCGRTLEVNEAWLRVF
jgi:hypothetical protein